MSEYETCSSCSQRLDAEDQLFEQADTIERLRMELMACGDARGIEGMEYEKKIERLRAALADAHDVLANGGDLNTDTYQTRCNRALAITREALQEGES